MLRKIFLASTALSLLPRRHDVLVPAYDESWRGDLWQHRPQVHVNHGLAGQLENVRTIAVLQNLLDHIDGAPSLRTVQEAAG